MTIQAGDIVKVTGRVAMKGMTGKVISTHTAQYKNNLAPYEYAEVKIAHLSHTIQAKYLTKVAGA